ncbi:Mitochondrial inner membrane organizing system component [Coemansia sp. RSA 353]|nr:Mitochondrial inner membrane organizing system component [Coemansia sp. RSA 532]KAJ2200709.1 Mitochondrial inner membrane organizing system component [Coemansia sp. RSA 522]KAJ2267475.1 Mitochondrial inner membrane organizing system component [Coemansia sp. RSA 451]KAJ2289917.1 Mitochondrial inner membrane organizing system component [Coemansia sp. RSA 353]KAJ2419408.1 Mitochondrial inner membrane organizing system component [Coemansia sp. RSA 2524]KAJ2435245.1 Mitochondrial inner membrane 
MAVEKIPSEDIVNKKASVDTNFDQATANLLVKAGLGLSIGVVASALLFKRRMWPVTFFTGAGVGAAYADAQRIFDSVSTLGLPVKNASTQAKDSA